MNARAASCTDQDQHTEESTGENTYRTTDSAHTQPAGARADAERRIPGTVGPVETAEAPFLEPLASPMPVQTYVTKLKYKDRHPKIYRCYKTVRRGALMASPIVHVGAELCQIGYFIAQFFI